jgi:hypothetical protein
MWTDLTTLQNVKVLTDQLGCGEGSLFSILCTLQFSTALSVTSCGSKSSHCRNNRGDKCAVAMMKGGMQQRPKSTKQR